MQYCFTKKYLIKTQKQTFGSSIHQENCSGSVFQSKRVDRHGHKEITAHQKHGTSLFCDIPELLYKVLNSLIFDVGHFSLLAKLENQFSTKPVSGL